MNFRIFFCVSAYVRRWRARPVRWGGLLTVCLLCFYLYPCSGQIVDPESPISLQESSPVVGMDAALPGRLNREGKGFRQKGIFQALRDKWVSFYRNPSYGRYVRLAVWFGGVLAAVALVLPTWIWLLRRQVSRRTQDLRTRVEELRERNEGIHKQKENLEITLQSITEAVITADTAGNITRMNGVAEHLTGWSFSEASGRSLVEVFHILDTRTREQCANPVQEVLKTGGTVGLANHTLLISRDGSEYQISDSGAPISDAEGNILGVVIVFRDVTEDYQMREALRQSEEKYKSLFYETPLGTFRYDANGVITECNQTFIQIIGSSREALVGLNMMRNLNNDRMIQEVKRSLKEGEGYYKGKYTSVTGGKTTAVKVMLKGLRGEKDQVVAGMGLVEDITKRQQVEDELRETNRELEETVEQLCIAQQQVVNHERQRALTTMASGIAHDFNNALSPIQGFSSMLLDEPALLQDQEKVRRYLNHIQKSASSAAETIRRMRKFYRPDEKADFTELNLNSIITDAVSITEPRWKEEMKVDGKKIEIKTCLDNIPAVKGNEAELNDMITNLIFNAVDAMPEGGRISVSTYLQEDNVILEFSDNGIGMSEDTKRKCLEPFYTEKGSEGSGLGLATVQGVTSRHNGELSIESKHGEGTTFCIALPIAESTAAVTDIKPKLQTNTLKILAVEDEEVQRELLQDILIADGHQVETASNGIEGIEKFNNDRFDLVISDRAMHEMSGDQLAEKIKESAPDIPVIMITGFGDMMDAAGEKPASVDVVLSKPMSKEKLSQAIGSVI